MKRITIMALTALAVMAFVGPTTAHAGGAHLLGLYKVEKHIDLEGEDEVYKIQCKTGDIAVDGMWRIDNVDQDNDYLYEPLHATPDWYDVLLSVETVSAYSTDVDEYTFEFLNQAGGDAQGKLFLTCLPLKVTPLGGHTVQWLPVPASGTSTVSGTTAPVTTAVPTSGLGMFTGTHSVAGDACPAGSIAIAPGFKYPSGGYGHVYQRVPNDYRYPTYWKWGFIGATSSNVSIYHRCLSLTSDWSGGAANVGHRHRISTSKKYKVTPPTLAKNLTDEAQAICGEHYKAMLGAWDFTSTHYTHLWYLGMDPRPKARAYKVLNTWNTDVNTDGTTVPFAKFGAVCFKDKTT